MDFLKYFNGGDSSGRDQVYECDPQAPHKAAFSHELIGGAAAFEAMKAYEGHLQANGQPPSHAVAKEIIAGLVGAEIDKLVETKGLDAWDQHKINAAREHAQKQAFEAFDQSDHAAQY
ncbi:hypothetical protein M231_00108 [Tremella mesenterica]|uniref:CipC protein n=1 Tax=Tremella mesenterica TaxID=5217 RepID=A0A4Q1BWK6_TREME|nr:hypothetical protein M231_00108 [Tremella mesenterica]